MKWKKNDIKSVPKKVIFEEGEKLYPVSKECDDRCNKNYPIKNWADIFYNLKEGKFKKRFIDIIKKSEYSSFFEGLNYEYGINNCSKDLVKALSIYKKAANNSFDTLSMYRMYHIYKKDYKKFNILKRNRIYEKFYLFKSFCFLDNQQLSREEFLFSRFDIFYEVYLHLSIEENDQMNIFPKFIKFLNKNYKLYDINKEDISLIEPIIYYRFKDEELDKLIAIEKLINLAYKEKNLEALYKLTYILKDEDEKEKEEKFKLLYEKKYYRSYIDYALFLSLKNRRKESLEILKIARDQGFFNAGFLYYDIILEENGFKAIMEEAIKNSFTKNCELFKLFEILIDDIVTDKVYSFYEYIFLRKICIKHYKFEKEINEYFDDFTKEILFYLNKMTKLTDKQINNYFFRNDCYPEFHLAFGAFNYYGIGNLLKNNNEIALKHFNISFGATNSETYNRFVFYFIYKIKKKLYKDNDEKKTEIKDIEKKIFNMYHKSLYDKVSKLSSSYFYYLFRLLNRKIGNNGNKILECICLKKSLEFKNDSPSSGSIISFYRKYKSNIIYEKNKDDYEKEFKNIQFQNDSEGYGKDGNICPICYENIRNVLSLPCKHLFCSFCINKMDKCPICRECILMKYNIN